MIFTTISAAASKEEVHGPTRIQEAIHMAHPFDASSMQPPRSAGYKLAGTESSGCNDLFDHSIQPLSCPETVQLWNCCACRDGPTAVAPSCTNCGHYRCGACPVSYGPK
ncbi:hypothetical protein P152DRAFT_446200 [Eremomyces bilateralis CBS 781.70]|uniref:Uncharacterized protein n=1 Tax=Eremomyces bilateralis CBS 781.70 TaxID=1392243 RepID=A0A6G1GFD1_9PEZI|nr:uncharacterized protein P152DRAFT_446200 [Eremomyces bilateralis CBS 781.70]KAF1816560.1 hypothetical protein P152DRAFT_446200 [Eremomyces bilateralis CBS 781.70]